MVCFQILQDQQWNQLNQSNNSNNITGRISNEYRRHSIGSTKSRDSHTHRGRDQGNCIYRISIIHARVLVFSHVY